VKSSHAYLASLICRSFLVLSVGAWLLVGASAARATGVFPGADWQVATPESQGLDSAKLNATMTYLASISHSDGNSCAVVIRHGYLVWQGTTIDRQLSAWSMTKSLMGAAMGTMVDDGWCSLSDKAYTYLPALSPTYSNVTLGHFATLTSGYNYQDDSHPLVPNATPKFAPGTKMCYDLAPDEMSNVLTHILNQHISNQTLYTRFKNRIGDPIGMTGWTWGTVGTVDGLTINGGTGIDQQAIQISARQLARFGLLYLNHGNWNGTQLISESWVTQTTQPQVPATTPCYDNNAWYSYLPGRYGDYFWTNAAVNGQRLWPSGPADTFLAQGNMNQFCMVIPEWDMVIVRMGADGAIPNNLFPGVYDGIFSRMEQALPEPATLALLGLGAAALAARRRRARA